MTDPSSTTDRVIDWAVDRQERNTRRACGVGPGMTPLIRPLRYAFALAVLWAVLAWNSPSTTYHLAPLLVAGVVPAALLLGDERSPWQAILGAGAAGASLALITTAVLGLTERLIGPSLLPSGGAVAEAVVFASLGAAVGVVAAAVTAVRRT